MDEAHSLFLKQIHGQIQTNRNVYINHAQKFDRLSLCLTIPSILLTSCTSVVALFISSATPETQSTLILGLGIVGILSTLIQSCNTNLKFGTKAEVFRSAAEQYDQLLIKIQFEQINHNEKYFIDHLEKRLLEIQSTCKYYPPVAYKSRPYQPS